MDVRIRQLERVRAAARMAQKQVSLDGSQTGKAMLTHFVTGSLPSRGGAFGKYITMGNSGGFCVGKHPKKIGRAFAPVEMKSATLSGIGGKPWCVVFKTSAKRFWLKTIEVPLEFVWQG